MKWLIIGILFISTAYGQTLSVKLKPRTYYYSCIIHYGDSLSKCGSLSKPNDRFILFKPLPEWGMFIAHKGIVNVYIRIGDIATTKIYKAYFNKYFFSEVLKVDTMKHYTIKPTK